jgi:hypothetical protein
MPGDDRPLIGNPSYENHDSSEQQRDGAQVPPMVVSNAVHQQLSEVLTTNGQLAGKA